MEQKYTPIQLKLDYNYIHTCHITVIDISGGIHAVHDILSVIYYPTQKEYTVVFLDHSAAGILPEELLRVAVVSPGDPGTPGWKPESDNLGTNADENPEADPWANVQEKSWDEFCGYGFLRFVNTFLHIFGWAIVLNRENGVVTKVYPARVPFRGFAEKDMTRGYRQIARFMEENASEIRKEAELG